MRPPLARARLIWAALSLPLVLGTCTEGGTGPSRHRAVLAVATTLPPAAELAAFNLAIDNVRLIVVRPSTQETLFDKVFPFPADQTSLPLSASVDLAQDQETLDVTIQLLAGIQVLFSGTRSVQVTSGDLSPTPADIPVSYEGPGKTVTSLTLDPQDTVLSFGDVLAFRPTARDAQNNPVLDFYLSWTTSDPTVAKIDATGRLTAPSVRGTFTVRAYTWDSITASTPITIMPVATAITVVSGCGQSGLPGTQLPQPVIVKVIASDNLGVKGVTVQFGTPPGGLVAPAQVVTDANGLAQTVVTLGSTPGSASFSISASGVPTVTCSPTVLAPAAQLTFTTQPTGNNVVAGTPFTVQVTARDGLGNTATSFAGSVTLALGTNPGGVTLSGTATVPAVAGVATFTNLGGLTKAGVYTLVATSGTLPPATSAPFTVVAAAPAQLAFTVGPPPTVAAMPIAPPLQVAIEDAFGNLVPVTKTVTMSFGSNPVSATLGGTLVLSSLAGVATFADLTINTSGTGFTLLASSPGLTPIVSAAFDVPIIEGSHLVFTTQPTDTTAGSVITPPVVVTALDAFANPDPTFTGAVTVAIGTNPSNGVLGGTLTVNAAAGAATFSDLSIDKPGTAYTLVATAPALPGATSAPFNVSSGNVAQLVCTSQPSNISAGTPLTPVVVTAQDGQGNTATGFTGSVSLAFGTHPVGTTLGGTTTVSATAGVATFSSLASLTVAGGYSIVASSPGLQSVVCGSFTIDPAPPAQLAFKVQPSTVSVGAVIAPIVQVAIEDAFGNTVTPAADNVTLAIGTNPGNAILGGTLTKAAASGVALFTNLTLSQVGVGYTLVAVSGSLTPATSTTFDVISGAVTHLAVVVTPPTVTAGVPASITVTAQDGSNNTVSAYRGTVHFTSADPQAVLPSDYTFVAGDNGTHVFPGGATLKTAGSQSVTATDVSNGTITGVQSVSVTPATASALFFTVQPNPTVVGAALTPPVQVTARDAFGNAATGFVDSVLVLIGNNPGSASLSGTLFHNAIAGVATFAGLSLDRAGVGYTLTASATGVTGATSAAFDIALVSATANAWTAPAGGAWSNPVNWSLARVPQVPDSVVISLSGTYTVTLDTTVSIAFLTFGGSSGVQSFAMAGRTLTVTNPVTIENPASAAVSNGTLAGAGVTNLGSLTLVSTTTNSAFTNLGTLLIHGTNTINGALTTVAGAGSVIRVEGANATGTGTLTVLNGFTNTAAIELTNANVNQAAQLLVTNGTLANTGAISALVGATGGARTLTAQLDNQSTGTLTVGQALTLNKASAAHTNSGTFTLSSGNLTLTQSGTTPSFTNTGVITIGSGLVWIISGGTLNQNSGSINGPGTLDLTSLTANLPAGFSNATLGLNVNNVTVNGPGTLTNASGQTLTLISSTINAPLTNQGTLIIHGSNTVNGTLTTVAGAGSVVRVEGANATGTGTLTVLNGFANAAAIELTNANVNQAATLVVTNGTLANTGTISVLVGATGGARTLTAQLDNQVGSTLTVDQALTINKGSAQHTNGGTITVSGANLTLTQSGTTPSFTNTGTITVGSGLFWIISGGTLNQNAGAINGSGTLDLTSLTANLPAGFSNAILALNVNNVIVNGPGTLTNASGHTLTLLSSTINAPLTNQGLVLVHGSNTVSGALTTVAGAGSVVRVEGINANGTGTLTVLNGFTNAAAIELTNANVNQAAQLTVTNGTLANTGTISALVGATGGARTLAAQLDNQSPGTLTVSQALTLNRGSSAHTNSGTITLSGGDLTLTQSGTTPSFTNTGTITIGGGRLWTISGGTLNQNSGSINGPGTLDLTSLTANFPAGFSNAALGLNLNNVIVNGPGTLTNAPTQTLTLISSTINAPLSNQGLLLVHGSNTVNGVLTTVAGAGSVIRVEGINANGTGTLTVLNGFTNTAGIELTNANVNQAATLVVTNGTLANTGTISVLVGATGGARTLTAQLDNQSTGSLTVSQALTLNRGSSAHTNSGTITVSGASLTLTQSGTTPSFTNTGAITIGSGLTWFISGGTLNQNAGSISGLGTLDLTSLTANFPAGFTNAAQGLNVNNVIVNGPGTLTNAPTQTLTLISSTINAPLTNQGLLVVHGSNTVNGVLTTVAGAGSVIRVEGANATGTGTLTVLNGFTNTAAIELTNANVNQAAQLTVTNGTLANTGTISALVGATGGGRTLTVQLDNQSTGTLTVGQALTLNHASAIHTNGGTITLNGGNLTLTQSGTTPSFTNTGAITIGSGLFWIINGGTLNQNAGSINGPGTLDLTSLTANFPAGFSNAALGLNLNNVIVNGPGTLTNAPTQTLTLISSTINAPLSNQGLLLVHGSNTVNGVLTTVAGAGSVIRVEGINANGTGTLTVLNGFTNTAAIELTNANVNQAAQLLVTTGTLANTGTISALVGATGGARTLTAQLDNQASGTLTLSQALTITKASVQHTNAGSIVLSGGDLTVTQSGASPSFTNSGLIDIPAGRKFVVNGGAFTIGTTGTVQGSGTVDVSTASSVSNSGILYPGTLTGQGKLTWTGALIETAVAVNQFELGGVNAGVDYDQLVVSGTTALGGVFNVTLVTGFTPPPGQQFVLVTFPTGSGFDFQAVNLPSLFTFSATPTQLIVTAP